MIMIFIIPLAYGNVKHIKETKTLCIQSPCSFGICNKIPIWSIDPRGSGELGDIFAAVCRDFEDEPLETSGGMGSGMGFIIAANPYPVLREQP